LRQAQKLLRLAERYGSQRIDAACQRALSFDLTDVYRLERILKLALEKETVAGSQLEFPAMQQKLRFLRPADHFSPTLTTGAQNLRKLLILRSRFP